MRRRTVEVQRTRQAPPIRLTQPRIRDFATDEEWAKTNGQGAGRRLDVIATPRWRAEVGEWFANWCGPYDDSAEVVVVDFHTTQRAVRAARDDEGHKIIGWARGVSAGTIDPTWSAR